MTSSRWGFALQRLRLQESFEFSNRIGFHSSRFSISVFDFLRFYHICTFVEVASFQIEALGSQVMAIQGRFFQMWITKCMVWLIWVNMIIQARNLHNWDSDDLQYVNNSWGCKSKEAFRNIETCHFIACNVIQVWHMWRCMLCASPIGASTVIWRTFILYVVQACAGLLWLHAPSMRSLHNAFVSISLYFFQLIHFVLELACKVIRDDQSTRIAWASNNFMQKELDHKIPEIHQALNDAATLGNWQNGTIMGHSSCQKQLKVSSSLQRWLSKMALKKCWWNWLRIFPNHGL